MEVGLARVCLSASMYVLCTVVSTFTWATAALLVKVEPRDANWRVTCGEREGGMNRGQSLCSRVERNSTHVIGRILSVSSSATCALRDEKHGTNPARTCMTGFMVKEAADIVAVLRATSTSDRVAGIDSEKATWKFGSSISFSRLEKAPKDDSSVGKKSRSSVDLID